MPTPPTVTVTPPSGFFNSNTLVSMGSGNITVALQDYVTGEFGDGIYEVNFVSDVNAVFGTGPSAPGVICTKGRTFPGLPFDTRVLKGYSFTVLYYAVIGQVDLRLVGGSSINNIIPGTVSIHNCSDVNDSGKVAGDSLVWNGSIWVPAETQSQSIRGPSDFHFHYAFVTPPVLDLTAEDGTTDLTMEDGVTQLTNESGGGGALHWWFDNGGTNGAVTLYLPDGTTPTVPANGTASSPNTYSPGSLGNVYLVAYAVLSGGVWGITITFRPYPFSVLPVDLQPAYAVGVFPLVAVYGNPALIGAIGSTSSGFLLGGAGTGLAA